MEEEIVLGVDIGTTSVKVCLWKRSQVLAKQTKDSAADVPSEQGIKGSKQDVPKLVSALHYCISRLPKDLLRAVKRIGICGQMHGVLLWNYPAWEFGTRIQAVKDDVTNLYTWQDSRCNKQFLDSLPDGDCHSGYGCATIFWFSRNKPQKLQSYRCAGTIQDFVVAALCDLQKPKMSPQNAASWGYFDTKTDTWKLDLLKDAQFPIDFLPEITPSGSVAGLLSKSWCGIPPNTPVGVALGDLQCSFLATLENPTDAVLNISTSAQLGFVTDRIGDHSKFVDYLPYFDDKLLAVAASLNGGNALAAFVKSLQQWCMEFGQSVPQAKVWEKLIQLGDADDSESSLIVRPLLLGERRDPSLSASVDGINLSNLTLGKVFRSTCEGLIRNLHQMMPREFLLNARIERIIGNGSGLSRNAVLQKAVERQYDLPLVFTCGGDAAKGAAVSTLTDTFVSQNIPNINI